MFNINISQVLFFYFLCLFFTINNTYGENLSDFSEYIKYLEERDKIISQNIANVDTSNYMPKDLQKNNDQFENTFDINLATTNQNHIALVDTASNHHIINSKITEIKPNNNGVTLTSELMKKTENSIEMQKTANLYSKLRSMIITSIHGN